MSENMVKKSVDITEEDDEWLEEQPINFSKFCRRKLAERRAENIRSHVKERLYNELEKMVEKSKELRQEWKNERKELQVEYGAEVIDMQRLFWAFKMNGSEWSTDWVAEEIYDKNDNQAEGDVEEFANKFTSLWMDKLDEFEEFVSEETSFEVQYHDESMMTLIGQNPMMDKFEVHTTYLPKSLDSFTVKFESRVDIETRDIEKSVESEF